MNEQGYVLTDRTLKTSVDGLYAAGDVCVKNLRQVVTAVGDGALAATELERYAATMQKKTGIRPQQPENPSKAEKKENQETGKQSQAGGGSLFDAQMVAQLNTIFSRMESSLVLKLYLDEQPVSLELKGYMEELAGMTDVLTVEVAQDHSVQPEERPCVKIYDAEGTFTGLAFHGVPGGHEFTSFVLGLYNAAGPGQALEPETLEQIKGISGQKDMKILVSLSCTMCPDLVTAAQRIAAENPLVTAEVYDLNHFPKLREKYNVMSVPCLVVNQGEKISFGKKNVKQVLELLGK